jgi:hypothetical protein
MRERREWVAGGMTTRGKDWKNERFLGCNLMLSLIKIDAVHVYLLFCPLLS